MQAVVTAQVRTFLVVSSVLAVLAAWLLLAAGSAQAHEKGGASLPGPSCGTIPDDTRVAPADVFLLVLR